MRIYKINGVEVTAEKRSLNITDEINERTVCSFTVLEPPFSITEGMKVEVIDGEKIFEGSIEDEKETIKNRIKMVKVSAVDYSQLVDTRLIADSFEDTLAGDIVRDFISDVFAEEGVVEGNIQDGPEVARAVFNYMNGNEAMNEVCELSGFNWEIDHEKKLHFFERSTNTAPFSITESTQFSNFQVEKNRANYRNRQYVRAGNDITEEIELEKPSPKPDGESRTFTMRFPVARKPRIFVNGSEIHEDDIGVNGLDEDKKFYFSFSSNTITQDDEETELADGDSLEVTYRGLYPVIVVSERPEQINDRKEVEGGSGIYEDVIEEKNIDTRGAALEFAKGKLEKYGIIPRKITFRVYEKGLKAGQLLDIDVPSLNVNGSFLIERVSIRDEGGIISYNVKCLDGQALGGWEQFFKELTGAKREFVIRDNEVLVLLNNVLESHGWQATIRTPPPEADKSPRDWSELMVGTAYLCLFPSEDLYPSENKFPC